MSRSPLFALTSLTLGLLLSELGVRAVVDRGLLDEPLRRIGPHGERLAAYATLRTRAPGDPLTPFTERDPDLGTRSLPGRHARKGHTVTVDERLVRVAPFPHNEGAPRILVFGDSFTWGYEVDDADVFTARVQAERPDLEVLNLAAPGYGHDQILDHFRRDGPAFQPDAVVLGAVQVDLQRNVRSFYTYEKPWYTLAGGQLVQHGVPVPDLQTWQSRRFWTPRLLDLGLVLGEGLRPAHRDEAGQTTLGAALIGAFVDLAVERGLPCLILVLPDGAKLPAAGEIAIPPFEAVARVCARPGVTCLDVGPALRDAWVAGVQVQGPSHWSAAGHEVIGRSWLDWMAATGWPESTAPP